MEIVKIKRYRRNGFVFEAIDLTPPKSIVLVILAVHGIPAIAGLYRSTEWKEIYDHFPNIPSGRVKRPFEWFTGDFLVYFTANPSCAAYFLLCYLLLDFVVFTLLMLFRFFFTKYTHHDHACLRKIKWAMNALFVALLSAVWIWDDGERLGLVKYSSCVVVLAAVVDYAINMEVLEKILQFKLMVIEERRQLMEEENEEAQRSRKALAMETIWLMLCIPLVSHKLIQFLRWVLESISK